MTITDAQFSALWRVRITPIGEAAVNHDSGGGVLSSVTLQLTSEGIGAFNFSLINTGGTYNGDYDIGDQVEIYLDASTGSVGTTKRLIGFIKNVSYAIGSDGNNMINISGMDYLSKFKRVMVRELYRGSRTFEDVITNGVDGLLALYDSTVTSAGVQTTGKSLSANDIFDFRYIYLYECLERIRNLVGDWVFYISPAKDLVFQPRGYTNNGKTLGAGDFGDCTINYDDDNMGNQVFLFGGKDFTALSKAGWAATKHASLSGTVANAFDGSLSTGWVGDVAQAVGHWYQLDLGSVQNFGRIYVDNSSFPTVYPRNYRIEASKDGTYYDTLTEVTGNTQRDIVCTLNTQNQYRYIRFWITAADSAKWSMGEIFVYSYLNMLSKMTDGASLSGYGQYDKKVSDSSIDIKAQMKTQLRKVLAESSSPNISLNLNTSYFFDCEPNEIISVTVPGTPISSTDLKVKSVSFSEGTYGSFQERIELVN